MSQLANTENATYWQPQVFDLQDNSQRVALEKLKLRGEVWCISDQIQAQLEDLVRTRNPQWQQLPDDSHQVATARNALLDGLDAHDYGRWVFYAWSGHLVHLLSDPEFSELRLNRNLNKLTAADQLLLAEKSIGVVGLSVGNAVAVALALEGIGGHLRLADLDVLDLSNMNRIRASVSDLGLPKTVLCARQIFEMNPYAKVAIVEQGLTDSNIDSFFDAEHPLDLVVDECDDIRMKLLLRDAAKARGLPVLMETSDRGMLDVERFDLEPERPLLHGLLGDVNAAAIPTDLSHEEKLRYIGPVVGIDSLSTRAAASMLEIGQTLSTWPQLGSDVLLGSATVATAAKQLFLDGELPSGRLHLDLAKAVAKPLDPLAKVPLTRPGEAQAEATQTSSRYNTSASPVPELMTFLVSSAVQAPSGGNSQPWCFYVEQQVLWVAQDLNRSANLIDADGRGAFIALGAAVENIRLAALQRGYQTKIEFQPTTLHLIPTTQRMVARLMFARQPLAATDQAQLNRLYPQIEMRQTDRKVYGGTPLSKRARSTLIAAAAESDCKLQLLEDQTSLKEVGTLVGEADRLRMLFDDTHREMMDEIRWSHHATLATRDGIDVTTLDLSLSELTALQIVKREDVAKFARNQCGAMVLAQQGQSAVVGSSAVGLVTIEGKSVEAQLRGGQSIQRLWLLATSLGLALHPITALIYMFTADFSPRLNTVERSKLSELCERFEQLFPKRHNDSQLLLFRLSVGQPSARRSLRRPLDDVLLPVPATQPSQLGDD